MKALKLFLLAGILSTFVFTSCNKDDQAVELPELTDSEWMSAFYNSNAAIDAGKVIDGEKFGVTINNDDLPESLRTHLEGKNTLTLESEVKVDGATAQSIWGDQIPDGIAMDKGFVINAQDVEIRQSYMSPEGEDLSELVKQDPDILTSRTDITIIEYTYIEGEVIGVVVNEDGEVVGLVVEIDYIEECTVIIIEE